MILFKSSRNAKWREIRASIVAFLIFKLYLKRAFVETSCRFAFLEQFAKTATVHEGFSF